MKESIATSVLLIFFMQFGIAQNQSMDSLSYSVGVMMGKSLESQGLDSLNLNDVANGIKDLLEGTDLKIDIQDAQQIISSYMEAAQKKAHQALIDEGKKFLAENSQREEVTALPSGLQYEVIQSGPDGPSPADTNKVTVHYTGMLLDGKVFDSSVERGQPASFGVTQVIKGWTEALQLMKVGDKWKIYIPENMGYGSRGAGRDIPPYSTLIFEIELLEIQ